MNMKESDMVKLICENPKELLGEDGLTHEKNEPVYGSGRPDIQFREAYGKVRRVLLIEVQKRELDEEHIQRHIKYYGAFKKENPEEIVRLMFVANTIHSEKKEFIRRNGWEYKEISMYQFIEILEREGLRILDEGSETQMKRDAEKMIPVAENGYRRHLSKGKERWEVDVLKDTFINVFQVSAPEKFGSISMGLKGLCDGKKGVQWNVWFEFKEEEAFLGVNLEGLTYEDWPISRLICRELEAPQIFDVILKLKKAEDIILQWRREYWQVRNRPPIKERDIEPTPISLNKLTPEGWKKALIGARGCLDAGRDYRGRGKQKVTLIKDGLPKGDPVEKKVSPHIFFKKRLWYPTSPDMGEWMKIMKREREVMQPLYDFVEMRST